MLDPTLERTFAAATAATAAAAAWRARFDRYLLDRADGDDAAHDIGHLRRVAATAARIAAVSGGNQLVVAAAAYFHDIENLPKNHPDRAQASRLSAVKAIGLLTADFPDFPAMLHPAVAHAIEAHSYSAQIRPQSIEARIVQDADRLEALGAIGLCRVFYIAGKLSQALFDSNDPIALHRDLDDRTYAVDHFRTKLLNLPAAMQTAEGKRLARKNARYMVEFLAKLSSEVDSDLDGRDLQVSQLLLKDLT